MYRIKYKIMALGLALIMCASVLVAAFLPEGSSAARPTASASQGLKLEEDDSLKLADTSSTFDESIVHIAEEVSGEHWLIVSLEGESLSESRGSASVAEYTSSARGKRAEKRLRNAQSDFLTDLRAEGIPFTYKYGYTLLTNAVAIKTDVKYAEDIASIDGVKSVDISEHYYAPKDIPVENEANVWGTGIYKVDGAAAEYDGAGMVAAILDTGLDSSHEVFQTMPENEDLLMTKEDVQRLVFEGSKNEGVLSIDPTVTVDDVYINEKVPFAYDYADKHADVYPSYSSHGTHVAGIIAGSPYLDENGEPAYIKDQDGNEILDKNGQPMEFRGVAPEAQLVICKVFSDEEENGTVGGADELDILAALGAIRHRKFGLCWLWITALFLLGYKIWEYVPAGRWPLDFSAMTYFLFAVAVLLPVRPLKAAASFSGMLAGSAGAGLHVGAGYVWNLSDKADLDLYARYLWTHLDSDSLSLSTGERLHFDSVDSHRLRLGARFAYTANEYVRPYIGAAWEQEFDGEARATTNGFDIDRPDLRGSTGMGELGITLTPSSTIPVSIDLGVQGYVGRREGVSGTLQVLWKF